MAQPINTSQYYRDLVQTKTKELNQLSAEWTLVCSSAVDLVPEQIQGEIRCACGLAKLLIDERFDQFSQLIDQSVFNIFVLRKILRH